MSEIQLGKGSKNYGVVDTEQLKGGIRREQLKTEEQKSIFDAADIDKNGVLDANEMQQFTEQLQDAAGNEKLSKREAKKFLKSRNLKDVDKKELFKFVNELSQSSENIAESKVVEQNGKKTILVTYKDGSQETINPDKTSQIMSTDQNNAVTTKFFDENRKLTKEQIVQENGDTETTEIENNLPVQKTIVTNKGSKTTVIDYENGHATTQTVKEGAVQSTYTYVDGQPILTQKVEDLGNDLKRISDYTYNDDTVTVNIMEPGKNTVQQLKDGKLLSEIITEGDKKTERLYKDDGTTQELVTQGENKTATIYNSETGKRLEQAKLVDGKQYAIEYDGEGNTKGIIVQNGESISEIAKKFGVSVDDLMVANEDKIKGKNTKYFNVGDEIKIPKELEADDKALHGRKSADEAKAEYARDEQIRQQRRAAARARDAAYREQLGLVDYKGAGEKVTGDYWDKNKKTGSVELTKIGNATHGRTIAKDKNGKIYVVAHNGVILKDSWVEVSAHRDAVKIGNSRYAVGDTRDAHGRKTVYDADGNTKVMSHDKKILTNSYVQQSDLADTVRADGKTAQTQTVNMLKQQFDSAKAAFDQQMREDGWAGYVADGISYLWNNDLFGGGTGNTARQVRQDLTEYQNTINELKAAASQGDNAFKVKFKEKFGIDYNQNAVADYLMKPTAENYTKAFGTKQSIGERVAKYNESQQTGATVVKTTAEIGGAVALTAATIATGGAAGVVAGAVVAAGSTVAADVIVETTDRWSSEQGLQEGEFTEILGNAATDGAIAGVTFGAGKALGAGYKVYKGAKAANAVNKGANAVGKIETGVAKAQQSGASGALSKTEEAVIDAISDVAVGAGAEYYQTGEVTVEGTLTNAAVGSAGIAGEKLGNKIKGSSLYNKIKDKFNGAGSSGEIQQISSANGRDVIADGETARNINQQHLNANQRKMVDEALEDVPTPEELDAYAKEIAYKAPTPEEQAAIDIHQAKVKQDYDDAHKIENNAVIKEQKTPSAVKTDIDKLNDEIKALDGSIRRIEQQIAGAKRFGKDTSKLESQLTNLQAQRKVKADKLSALETANANSDVGLNASDNLEDKANDLEPLQSSLLTSEDRMAMAQIGNNINRAKTLEDLEAAQDWLDKLPECGQKTRLQSQLVEKLGQLSDIPDNIGKNKADNFTSDIKSGKSGGKSNSAASSKRPQYRAGIDYNQAPSFTQYSKAELRNMFEAEPLSADRFRQLAENYYDDLRLSGKYTMEESITGNFDDFLDYNPSINGIDVYFDPANGWIWHEFNNGCKRIGKDRISLATKADPQMLAELDELLLKGSYTDAAGNVHQLKGKEFSRGFYKTDTNEESWCQRHDPLTFYFDETVSDEMIDALAIVTDKYKRIPQRELPGAVDGCPWIAHEAYTTGADIDALIKEAAKVDGNLADALKSEGRNISTGQYNSYKKLLADYKQYLSL